MSLSDILVKLQDDETKQLDKQKLLDQLVKDLGKGIQAESLNLAECSIEILHRLLNTFTEEFELYFSVLLPKIAERLGDVKASIQEKVEKFIWDSMEAYGCERVWAELNPQLQHHNSRNKQQTLFLIPPARAQYGSQFPLETLLELMLPSVSDGNLALRQTAAEVFEQLFMMTGNTLLIWLIAKPETKQLAALRERFETLTPNANAIPLKFKSESRLKRPSSGGKPAATAPAENRKTLANRQQAGQAVPTVDKEGSELILIEIGGSTSEREIRDVLGSVDHLLGTKVEWEQRVAALQRIERVGVACTPGQAGLFLSLFRPLIGRVMECATDLRSQVCRAGCSLFANLARALRTALAQDAAELMAGLLPKLSVAKEVIANSAYYAMRHILQNVGVAPEMTAVLADTARENKSHLIRARAVEFLAVQLLSETTSAVAVESAIVASLKDANNLCRQQGRLALRALVSVAPDTAQKLFLSLDASSQKQIDLSVPVTLDDLKSNGAKRLESTASAKKVTATTAAKPVERPRSLKESGAGEEKPADGSKLPPWKRKPAGQIPEPAVEISVVSAPESAVVAQEPAAPAQAPVATSNLPPWKQKRKVQQEQQVEFVLVEEPATSAEPVAAVLPPWKQSGRSRVAPVDVMMMESETETETEKEEEEKEKKQPKLESQQIVSDPEILEPTTSSHVELDQHTQTEESEQAEPTEPTQEEKQSIEAENPATAESDCQAGESELGALLSQASTLLSQPDQADIDAILRSVGIGTETPLKSSNHSGSALISPLKSPVSYAAPASPLATQPIERSWSPLRAASPLSLRPESPKPASPLKAPSSPAQASKTIVTESQAASHKGTQQKENNTPAALALARADGADEWSEVSRLVAQPLAASVCEQLLTRGYCTARSRRAAEAYLAAAGELPGPALTGLLREATWHNGALILAEAAAAKGKLSPDELAAFLAAMPAGQSPATRLLAVQLLRTLQAADLFTSESTAWAAKHQLQHFLA